MTPVERLLAELSGVKRTGKGWSARCPAHDDARASLSMSEGDDGRVLMKCHAGCPTEAVVSALGLSMSDLFLRTDTSALARKTPKPGGKVYPRVAEAVADLEQRHGPRSDMWVYRHADGEPVGVVVRWDRPDGNKDIRPVSRFPDGWRVAAMPEPRPLYALPELAEAKRVVVVEGEKCVDAARSLGFVATTSAGGSNAAAKTDWRPLAGKEVLILPDNDPPGRRYGEDAAKKLLALDPATVVRVVDLPDLPEGGDIADWIATHGDAAEPAGMRAELEALAAAVAPVAVVQPDEDDADLTYRPFPVDVLPEPIRGFVKTCSGSILCDPSYIALPTLVAVAAAVGTVRRLELKPGWTVPAILWGAAVGESGTAKSPAFKLAMKPVRERQRKALARYAEAMKRHEAELVKWEKEMAAWKRDNNTTDNPPEKPDTPLCERFIVSDTTVEALTPVLMANPRGLLLARDELAGWLGSFDRYAGKGGVGGDSPNWLSMFNAEGITVDRKTGFPRTVVVPDAAVSVVGGIQPGILKRALGDEHRESGLAARLLLTFPPRRTKRWVEGGIDPACENEWGRLYDRLHDLKPDFNEEGEPRPVTVRLTAGAKALWVAYYNTHATEQADLVGELSAAWSKLEEYAARLALAIHFVRWAADQVQDETLLDDVSMDAGIKLTNWFKHEARRVYGMLNESEEQRDCRRLEEWIARRGGWASERAVQRGCSWLKAPGAAEEALDKLAKAHRGRWETTQNANGGRPARVFVLATSSTLSTIDRTPKNAEKIEVVSIVDSVDSLTDPTDFPYGMNNPTDPDGERLFPEHRGLPD